MTEAGHEVIYASWGGNGRSGALRSAFEAAVERDVPLLYLAVLDGDHFGDLDDSYLDLVVDELEWLLESQLRLVADQLDAEGHRARYVVHVGDVLDEITEVVAATEASLVLVPADAQPSSSFGDGDLISTIAERTGTTVETV